MLSTEQKAIIRKICKKQTKSLMRVVTQQSEKIYNDLIEDGYDVTFLDIANEVTQSIKKWEEVKDDPDKFLQLLDETNVGMIKHYLVQDYLYKEPTKGIWKKLNLRDQVNENPN